MWMSRHLTGWISDGKLTNIFRILSHQKDQIIYWKEKDANQVGKSLMQSLLNPWKSSFPTKPIRENDELDIGSYKMGTY